jgi:hypothetical protein
MLRTQSHSLDEAMRSRVIETIEGMLIQMANCGAAINSAFTLITGHSLEAVKADPAWRFRDLRSLISANCARARHRSEYQAVRRR